MNIEVGIIAAFIAMFAWGFGDFLIQKSTRKIGNFATLLFISLLGTIVLFPFIYKDLSSLFTIDKIGVLYVLILASFIILIAAILEFEALKRGKLTVVEPLWSLEVPISIVLAYFIINEIIGFKQIILIVFLIAGLILISLKEDHHFNKSSWFERGALLAAFSALVMGAANFYIGYGARLSDPLMMNWFLSVFLTIICLIYLSIKGELKTSFKIFMKNKKYLIPMCFLDNIAWIAFAFAMVLAPIGIAVALSESYIIIAVLLGMFVNREKLKLHQKIGLVLAIISAIVLAYISG